MKSLLELVYPEVCALCGAERGGARWAPREGDAKGLRFWDGTHLCAGCGEGLAVDRVFGEVESGDGASLRIAAGARTNPDLVRLVGQFKYHGMRGLAWPLANLLRQPFSAAREELGPVDALVPIALHSRRRRVRGFNQAEILARVLTAGSDFPVLTKVLVRRRNTNQQAKLSSPGDRRRNLAGSFAVREPARTEGRPFRVALVDDLVTSGWTVLAAAAVMRAAGWRVPWALTLGLAGPAKNSRRQVDTWKDGF